MNYVRVSFFANRLTLHVYLRQWPFQTFHFVLIHLNLIYYGVDLIWAELGGSYIVRRLAFLAMNQQVSVRKQA